MSSLSFLYTHSVGRKIIMGITGLFLVSFLFVHLSGNLLLFNVGNDGGLAFNEYVRFMTTNPLIRVMEWVLFGGFLLHILYSLLLTRHNQVARPETYAYKGKKAKNSSWFSRNMGLTGSIIFAFLAIHLVMFWGKYKWGDGETTTLETAYSYAYKVKQDITFDGEILVKNGGYIDAETMAELRRANDPALLSQSITAISMTDVVRASFKEWYISLFYVISMLLLAFHLSHGFQSAFRSLGLVHKKYMPTILLFGRLIAVAVPLVFAAMPIYFLILGFSAH